MRAKALVTQETATYNSGGLFFVKAFGSKLKRNINPLDDL